MSVSINNNSRLNFADLLTVDNIEFWDTVVLPSWRPRGDEITYSVTGNDRIDLISQSVYQTAALWWVIAWANDLELVPCSLNEGQTLTIPAPSYVALLLQHKVT